VGKDTARERVEARAGIEPAIKGFADLSLTAWVPRHSEVIARFYRRSANWSGNFRSILLWKTTPFSRRRYHWYLECCIAVQGPVSEAVAAWVTIPVDPCSVSSAAVVGYGDGSKTPTRNYFICRVLEEILLSQISLCWEDGWSGKEITSAESS
jgi:hypothetical protein